MSSGGGAVILRNDGVQLVPVPADGAPAIDVYGIMRAWMDADFDVNACRAIFEEGVKAAQVPASWVRPEAITEDATQTFVTDEVLFWSSGRAEQWLLDVTRGERAISTVFSAEHTRDVGAFLRHAFASGDVNELRRLAEGRLDPSFVEALVTEPHPAVALPRWQPITSDAVGIHRHYHASLVVRSRTTTLLVDPTRMQWAQMGTLPLDVGPVDGVLISHSHGDHWHVPSILKYAGRADVPVIVPKVPRRSLLTPDDFAETLTMFGQAALAPEWGSTVTIGDIEIDILPFYGEQPCREPPGPASPDLRNWGNCYRFNTPDFSATILVDSGADPAGDMRDVLEANTKRRGPVDALLSCARTFPCPFFGGLEPYFLTLSFPRLQELYRRLRAGTLPSVTASPEGIAELCGIAQARAFLPYAHMWGEGLGKPVEDIAGGADEETCAESEVIRRIRSQLSGSSGTTRVVAWNPGDVARMHDGKLDIASYPGS
jgi:L-ascorbate metabolism protein UlaG (beta-lactamase superfamily)